MHKYVVLLMDEFVLKSIFNSLKALAFKYVPCLWTNGYIMNFQNIYDVFSSTCMIVWEPFIFVISFKIVHRRQAAKDE